MSEAFTASFISAAAANASETLPRMGRYQLRQVIGAGGFGTVYRAYDPALDREVALKVQRLEYKQPGLEERFVREAKAAARLHHPNIVQVFDCGVAGDAFFIAAELVDGVSLAQRLSKDRPSHRQSATWVRDLALALHYAHTQGLVHRDVKPGNILIQHNRPRLTDFGLAKRLTDGPVPVPASLGDSPSLTVEGVVMGTIGYMAPEQARGETTVGPHSDQFSLGVVLFELLTGRKPFVGDRMEILAQAADPSMPAPRLCDFDGQIPLGLEAIALKALRKLPEERYASMAEFAVDLQRWLKGEPVEASIVSSAGAARTCPRCKRDSVNRPNCMYCGAELAGVEPKSVPVNRIVEALDEVVAEGVKNQNLDLLLATFAEGEISATENDRRFITVVMLGAVFGAAAGAMLWVFFGTLTGPFPDEIAIAGAALFGGLVGALIGLGHAMRRRRKPLAPARNCPRCGETVAQGAILCNKCLGKAYAQSIQHPERTPAPDAPLPGTASERKRHPFVCPDCGRNNPAHAPRCLYCGSELTNEASAKAGEDIRMLDAAAAEEDEDQDAEHSFPPHVRARLAIVRLGLGLHFVRLLLFLGSLVALVLLGLLGALTEAALPVLPLAILGVILCVQPILGITGSVLCLWTPRESRARGFLLTSLLLDGGGSLAGAVLLFVDVSGYLPEIFTPAVRIPGVLSSCLGLIAWVYFMNFLNRLGEYVEEYDAAYEAVALVRRAVILMVGPPLVMTAAMLLFAPVVARVIAVLTPIVWILLLIEFFIRFLGVIGLLHATIGSRL